MGCCPSKSKARAEAAPAEGIAQLTQADPLADRPGLGIRDVRSTPRATLPDHAPLRKDEALTTRASPRLRDMSLLLDRGDGEQIAKSDSDIDMERGACLEELEEDRSPSLVKPLSPTDRDPTDTQLRSTEGESGSLTPRKSISIGFDPSVMASVTSEDSYMGTNSMSSPTRRPINADEMPINSTYHRVQVAKTEELELQRLEERRLEAEQRQREIDEFKASMVLK